MEREERQKRMMERNIKNSKEGMRKIKRAGGRKDRKDGK